MPNIRPSADLRENYNEISDFCHENAEPVFITKEGKGDLAVMSIDMYERLCGKQELYALIEEGFEDERQGRVRPYADVIADIRKRHK